MFGNNKPQPSRPRKRSGSSRPSARSRGRIPESHSSRMMNAGSVHFSSPRRQKRATRGYVDNVFAGAVGEDGAAPARRVSRRQYTSEIKRRALVKRIVFIAICLLVIVGVALGVGAFTFFNSVNSKLSLDGSNAAEALKAPEEDGAAAYTLLAVDLDKEGDRHQAEGYDAFVLLRVNPSASASEALVIPASTCVTIDDSEDHELREITKDGGDAALVSKISALVGVDVAHFVSLNAADFEKLVDDLGGVSVDVADEVDDPRAGTEYLKAGEQTINGAQARTLARATNYEDPVAGQAANQIRLLSGILTKFFAPDDSIAFLSQLDSMGGLLKTDCSSSVMESAYGVFHQGKLESKNAAALPGYTQDRNGVTYFFPSSDSVGSMVERMNADQSPLGKGAQGSDVDPASFTITVRNGSGVTGGAAAISDTLKEQGFKVTETGNTDSFAYDETLVIYKDDKFKSACEAVVSALGVGRTVDDSAGFYEFGTDVMVVLGKDWKPTS